MNFEAMFREIHGYDPFPWQTNAAKCLTETNSNLSIDVPTAAGKTGLIDAAIYSAFHGGPRRIMFIIDRRVVVDEAYIRAQRIAQAMQSRALESISSTIGPIKVVRLRGGVQGDDEWVLYPEYTTIIVSTVDQIGSRLLHRGYGVSPRMAPVHAGFVGNDSIYIIDEAHLSQPFVETVKACSRFGANIRTVMMTATHIGKEPVTVALSDQDHHNDTLKKRMQNSKLARLIDGPSTDGDFCKALVETADGIDHSIRIVGVVVNRVSTARRVWELLKKAKKEAVLLTGRVRPYDRDQLMKELLPVIKAGRKREEGPQLFIVSTQTIEVGADIDFDALITEAAPLDALRQRFGRLDRLGELGKTDASILYRNQNSKTIKPDPIYGMDIHETWQWLQAVQEEGIVDFGIQWIEETIKKVPPPRSKPTHAPIFSKIHINLLSQTGPDAPYMDIAPWLHGVQKASSDVSIIWRADLISEFQSQMEALRLRPPISNEALQIPIYAARAWLQGQIPEDISDAEGLHVDSILRSNADVKVLRWRGSDDIEQILPNELTPGDTIIVPSSLGGCDRYGWSPKDSTPVKDIADHCSLERGSKSHVVRLVPGLMDWFGDKKASIIEIVNEIYAAETTVDEETGLDNERIQAAHNSLRNALQAIDHDLINAFEGHYTIELHPMGVVLRSRANDEINGTFSGGVKVQLDTHLKGVEVKAAELASKSPELDKIAIAAQLHDIGKSESRFQIMLHGNPIAAAAGPLLAKSGLRKLSEKRAAYFISGLPKGFRHELATLDLIDNEDPLVQYLIATHHGYGRPWFPICSDLEALGVRHSLIGSGWSATFAILRDQYGPWGLAGLEQMIRVSDSRQSILEQESNNA